MEQTVPQPTVNRRVTFGAHFDPLDVPAGTDLADAIREHANAAMPDAGIEVVVEDTGDIGIVWIDKTDPIAFFARLVK